MLINSKTIAKLYNIESRYEKLRFKKVDEVAVSMWETYEHYSKVPVEAEWREVSKGTKWGNEGRTAWFKGSLTLPEVCIGEKVYIRANTQAVETLFIVNGKSYGLFDEFHPVVMMTTEGCENTTYELAFEAYAGHNKMGADVNMLEGPFVTEGCRTFNGIDVLLERTYVSEFVFDFKVLRQLAGCLDEHSLRKNNILKGLVKVVEIVDNLPVETCEESWMEKLALAREIMKPLLEATNGSTAPSFGVVGHSHIDTAWLWTISETHRKCARTFSSVLNLMDQYPDFKFVQSAPYHAEVMAEKYPDIYEGIKAKVREGRWEPNGAMYIEPDCNIPSGESFIRQLLVGQKSTRDMFGYTSNTLWMPDVFGYSAALPQILKGCNVDYFCTTKLSWNDTNRFPYDTFVWKGIDGTSVVSHFNYIHCSPDPKTLTEQWNNVQHKDVQDRRLTAIGYGDGGGGPVQEMLEVSKRVTNLEGCPKAHHTTVGKFMEDLEKDLGEQLPVWNGELYLELHRGTLTSVSKIKRGNRKLEVALRDAELLSTIAALKGEEYPKEKLIKIWKEFLVNQFHDILPGSSIAEVNDEAIEAFDRLINDTKEISKEAISKIVTTEDEEKSDVMVINTLSWPRTQGIELSGIPEGKYPVDDTLKAQWIENIQGDKKLIVSGVTVPALGSKKLELEEKSIEQESLFKVYENKVETPFYSIEFDNLGRIVYLLNKSNNRNLVRRGGAINTLWIGEDIPAFWDNWDIDVDQETRMKVENGFISREVICDGALQLRLRQKFNIGKNSSMIQDIVLHSDNNQIDFENEVKWAEKHTLLKVGFDMDLLVDKAKHEIQYGYVERATHKNLSEDRARFEVCNHKWTDISEEGFGVALLNDCKYGIGVYENDMKLTLIKGGTRPDTRGDEGTHLFTYSLLPHEGNFSVEKVTRAAYELNMPVISTLVSKDAIELEGIIKVDSPNVIIESIKWSEYGQGFVARIYDAAKSTTNINVEINVPVKEVIETNMLEEEKEKLEIVDGKVTLTVKPFEIRTLLFKL